MQFPHTPLPAQLTLFEAFMAQPMAPAIKDVLESPWSAEPEVSVNCRCAVPPETA